MIVDTYINGKMHKLELVRETALSFWVKFNGSTIQRKKNRDICPGEKIKRMKMYRGKLYWNPPNG